MSSVSDLLSQYDLSVDDARQFVMGHLSSPEIIYATAAEFGITFDMLAEIYGQGVTGSQVQDFFSDQNMIADGNAPVWNEAYRVGDYSSMYQSTSQSGSDDHSDNTDSSATDDHSDNTDSSATDLILGSTVNGEIELNGDKDVFEYSLIKGEKYTLTVNNQRDEEAAPVLGDETISAFISPDSLDYNYLNYQGLSVTGNDSSSLTFEAELTGTYFIEVGNLFGTSREINDNHYSLKLDHSTEPDDHSDMLDSAATDISFNEAVSGVIELNGDRDSFELELSAGQSYTLTLSNTESFTIGQRTISATVYAPLYDNIFGSVGSIGTALSTETKNTTFQAEQSGTHYIQIKNTSAGTAFKSDNIPYTFQIEQASSARLVDEAELTGVQFMGSENMI